MCVIFELKPNQNIDDNLLENAVANNWHGWGVVLKDEQAKRMEVRREFSESNGADPESIARFLKDNSDITRYVHLRHNTAGENGVDNCHPFSIYNSNTREVYLFHNGTIYDYKPKAGDARNDSRIFCEEFVSELLLRFEGDMGRGDYNHPLVKNILHKQIGGANRLLIVSNDLDPLMVGDWSTIRNKDGSEFRASNNDYFSQIKRGPRHNYRPFQASTQAAHAVVPYGAGQNLRTQTTGATTGSNSQVQRSPANQTGTALIAEAKEARETTAAQKPSNVVDSSVSGASRPVVPLKDVENYNGPVPYVAPPALLEALGVSRKLFEDYGFDCLTWMRDEELANGLKQMSPVALADMMRALVETAQEQSVELDLAEQTIAQLCENNRRLEEKHRKASLKIEEMKAGATVVEFERKVG